MKTKILDKATCINLYQLPARECKQASCSRLQACVCLTITLIFVLPSITGAQSIDAAHAAYTEGQFIEAARLGEALNTSEGYALAASSLAIFGYHIAEDDKKQALFDRATQLAQEAIRLDATNPDAHFQLAHAMGRHAQTIRILEAVGEEYPEKVREALENTLRLDPEMAVAHLSLGAWHAEAVSSGGFMAKVLYGASKKEAHKHYEKALKLAPDKKVLLVECARGLLLLGRKKNRDQARDLLARAIKMPSKDAHDRIFHQKAVERLAALKIQKPESVQQTPSGPVR